ncbi:DUF4340 domain-containing protein [Verrucomicrobiaceae bacterium N1E253]|uniref:DUF4340 domain-containing protein n=1 Tax=Oceaniferula marina TaxID=2748318 RepID=A0A851GEG0_9BACT|nr:DUF4340 domain-containing protein [Oceaniferula marina]NWK54101.1 DUF4340 domain-containing protein [Oceaniferula marina]
MKQRTVIILWSIAIVLGIAAYFVKFHGNETVGSQTNRVAGDKVLPKLPIRELTSVTLQQGDELTTLVRGENNLWTVKERGHYPANHELLRNLLGTLHEVKVTQGFPCSAKHFGKFGLAKESEEASDLGLKVSMNNSSGETLAEAYLGKYSGTGRGDAGRFIRVTGDDSGIYAVGETFPGVYADAPSWLEKQFLSIQNIQSVKVSAPSDPNFVSWELRREGNQASSQFKLADLGEKESMQVTSTAPLRNLFSYSSFQDVLSKEEAGASANPDAKLKRQAVIQTFDGITYQLAYWPQKEPATESHDPESPLPPAQAAWLLTVNITAELPKERSKQADEKAEDAARLDAEFATRQNQLKEQLEQSRVFEGRIYQVGHTTLTALQKNRSDFVTSKAPAVDSPSVAIPPVHQP